MRIVVSGTHASGKSTLISDVTQVHPELAVLVDPYELIDEAWDQPNAAMFWAQLRVSAERLISGEAGSHFIAERGPLDFLAYLLALAEVTATPLPTDLIDRSLTLTRDALAYVDLVVVLPLAEAHPIGAGEEENLELRDTMNDVLLDLIDDIDLVGDRATVIEVAGTREQRRATVLAHLDSR